MHEQAFQLVRADDWTPFPGWQSDNYTPSTAPSYPGEWGHRVPALTSTVLALDLLSQSSCIDLQAASDIVLSDVGATLQVLQLIGVEYMFASERPWRMEECLANLDADAWFSAVAGQTVSRSRNHSKLATLWQHSRVVGHYAKLIAESLDNVSAEQAYLVGLLHEADTIPQLLNIHNVDSADETVTLRDVTPDFVLAAIDQARERGSSSVWRYILASAHALAAAIPHIDSAGQRVIK